MASARVFAGTTSVANHVTIGDVTDIRFQVANSWTAMCFFYATTLAGEERCLYEKHADHFRARLNASQKLHIKHGTGGAWTATGTACSVNTWYLAVVSRDGATTYGRIVNLDGTSLQSGSGSGASSDGPNLTADLTIAHRLSSLADPFLGRIAHAIYVKSDLTNGGSLTQDILSYLADPFRMARVWDEAYGVPFHLPLGLASPEPDYSRNGNNGTVVGTDADGAGAPVALLSRWWWGALIETGVGPDQDLTWQGGGAYLPPEEEIEVLAY